MHKLDRWRRKRCLTWRDAARILGVKASTLEKIAQGGGTTVDTGLRIVAGCDGEVAITDLKRKRRRAA